MQIPPLAPFRFGMFELDPEAGELRRNGAPVRLPPQPFKLLVLLVSQPGRVVTRERIKNELWGEQTFVDFDQGMNFTVKQIREALGDDADRPLYVQTLHRRGYRFIAPVQQAGVTLAAEKPPRRGVTDINLQKALWENIAELKLSERRRIRMLTIAAAIVGIVALLVILRAVL